MIDIRCRCKACKGPGLCRCCDEPKFDLPDDLYDDIPYIQPTVAFSMTCIHEDRYKAMAAMLERCADYFGINSWDFEQKYGADWFSDAGEKMADDIRSVLRETTDE